VYVLALTREPLPAIPVVAQVLPYSACRIHGINLTPIMLAGGIRTYVEVLLAQLSRHRWQRFAYL